MTIGNWADSAHLATRESGHDTNGFCNISYRTGFVKFTPKFASTHSESEDIVSKYATKVFRNLDIPRSSPYRESSYCHIAFHHFHPEILKEHAANQQVDTKSKFPKTITSKLAAVLNFAVSEKVKGSKGQYYCIPSHSNASLP